MTIRKAHVDSLKCAITDEAFRALGFPADGRVRRLFGPLMGPAANRLANLAASFDQDLANFGISETARRYLPRFIDAITVCGKQNIPADGPLLIVSNHPGTLDGFVIISNLLRDDLKLIISGVPFVQALPAASRYLIYTPADAQLRIKTVRAAIRHLESGGVLLIFPTGILDPDPWSPSLEIFLRKVPQTKVLVTIVSGVLSPSCLRNPLTRLRKEFWQQQRIAEYIQVIQMMFFAKKFNLNPKVTFGEPLSTSELLAAGDVESIMGVIIDQARQVLAIHTASAGCLADEN